MAEKSRRITNRRSFLKTAGAGFGAAGMLLASEGGVIARPVTEKEKLDRIASNTWPIRYIFKPRRQGRSNPRSEEMKKKYGEITMLDFPDFTKKTFPGVTKMDLFSGLFGDVTDSSMYVSATVEYNGRTFKTEEFDPSCASGKKWLEKMANKMAATGTHCQHISNNAPRNICDMDPAKRREGIQVAKNWLDGAAMLGAKSMRVNSGGPRIAPEAVMEPRSYPKNDKLA